MKTLSHGSVESVAGTAPRGYWLSASSLDILASSSIGLILDSRNIYEENACIIVLLVERIPMNMPVSNAACCVPYACSASELASGGGKCE